MADLPNRELSTKLASGEVTVIKLGGTAAGDSVAKVGDISAAPGLLEYAPTSRMFAPSDRSFSARMRSSSEFEYLLPA